MIVHPWAIVGAAGASACVTVLAHYLHWRTVFLFVKPATTLMIVALALLAPTGGGEPVVRLILAGLVMSTIGDIFLMFESRFFLHGLASFFLAHCCYVVAFGAGVDTFVWTGAAWALCLIVAGLLLAILPSSRSMALPVCLYAIAILGMQLAALGQWQSQGSRECLLVLAGAWLFLFSDGVLAINKFVVQFRPAQALILGSYFPAQILIALSLY